jgi:parvulin-like peptidyl-prolyl isomerase
MTRRCGGAGRAVWRSVVIAAAVVAASAGVTLHGAELLDRVIAVVSGTVITLSDARAAIALGLVDTAAASDPVEAALRWLVDRQIVLDEAARSGAGEDDEPRLRREMDVIRRRFASDSAYGAALTRLGLNDARVEALVRNTIVARQYVERRFDAVLPPSDEELHEFYLAHRDRFVRDLRQLTFEEAAGDVRAKTEQDRREQAIATWMERLRRRADITEVYKPTR